MSLFGIKKEENHVVLSVFGIHMKFKQSSFNGYRIHGDNNRIIVVKDGKERLLGKFETIKGLEIKINGNNNYIKIACNNFSGSSIELHSDNSKIIINDSPRIFGLNVHTCCGNNQKLIWGEGSHTWGTYINLNEEGAVCIIGKNCMFSTLISIWPTDGHVIFDSNTDAILNNDKKGVIIGDHCWICQSVMLGKNSVIPNNCVVGAYSVVTKAFEKENSIIAGNPAKVVKENIKWDIRTPYEYAKYNS
jgi:acetyltransferase-like isoleucine patch superfamily enzyme